MENETILYDDGVHKCVMFSFDNQTQEDKFLSINQYLIVQNNSAILIDPGSDEVFDEVYDAVLRHIDIDTLKYIFFSHQDPDVAGSIASWAIAAHSAKIVVSKLWVRFMGHYGLMDMDKIIALEDSGTTMHFGDEFIAFVGAHFLHSPGNFALYDSKSGILFSGDIGAAIVPISKLYKNVEDFDAHLPYLEGFHARYMASNQACRSFVNKLKAYDIKTIAPQHGALMQGKNAQKFFTWFENLECGIDLL